MGKNIHNKSTGVKYHGEVTRTITLSGRDAVVWRRAADAAGLPLGAWIAEMLHKRMIRT